LIGLGTDVLSPFGLHGFVKENLNGVGHAFKPVVGEQLDCILQIESSNQKYRTKVTAPGRFLKDSPHRWPSTALRNAVELRKPDTKAYFLTAIEARSAPATLPADSENAHHDLLDESHWLLL
jgi:hypothetical protein